MSRALGTLLTVTVAFAGGVITGILLSPQSGKENRKWISNQSDEAKNWIEDKGKHFLKESEERLDKISSGVKRTVKEKLPDLYEATESLHFDEEEMEDA